MGNNTVSPKSINKNIDQLKARLRVLQEQEQQLIGQRRKLLTSAQDAKTEHTLEQIETQLLVAIHGKETAESRLKELQALLPGLKKEEAQARDRLQKLTATVHKKLSEIEDVDKKILEQVQDLFTVLDSRNKLAQEICDPTVEGQYLAMRFSLSGATGDRTPAHPFGSVLMDQLRRLTLFEPTKPAALTDQLRELRQQQNRAGKAERQEQEEKRRRALQPA